MPSLFMNGCAIYVRGEEPQCTAEVLLGMVRTLDEAGGRGEVTDYSGLSRIGGGMDLDLIIARYALAVKFNAMPIAFKFRAIAEQWDAQTLNREMF